MMAIPPKSILNGLDDFESAPLVLQLGQAFDGAQCKEITGSNQKERQEDRKDDLTENFSRHRHDAYCMSNCPR